MILQRIKKKNGIPVAFIIDKGNGVQTIQKLNGSVLGWYRHGKNSSGDRFGRIGYPSRKTHSFLQRG